MQIFIDIDVNDEPLLRCNVGSRALTGFLSSVADDEENSALFSLLADHDSLSVRLEISGKNNLDESAIALLANDGSVSVRRRICSHPKFCDWASTATIIALIEADSECAIIIAHHIDLFANADRARITEELLQHPDPDVRLALVDGWSTAKSIARRLTIDADADVRAAAKVAFD